MRGLRGCALALASLSAIACSSGSTNSGGPSSDDGGGADVITAATDSGGGSDASQTVTQTVGASGGTVSAAGVVLTIPAGAVSSDTMITITTGTVAVPTGYVAVSPVYSFEPAGTTFAVPVTVELTLTGSGAGASVFGSNASGGYDALPTTSTATGLSAPISRLGNCFAGGDRRDAGTSTDAGPLNDAGTAADTGTAVDAGTASDSGGAGDGQAGTGDSGAPETSVSDAPAGDAPGDGSTTDAGAPQGIWVTIDGSPTTFGYNVRATLMQAWWYLYADDSASGPHWTMGLGVPTNAATLTCNGSGFLFVTYTHYTASGDAGAADITFTSVSNTASSCTITETTTAQTQGQHAMGTFSGTLVQPTDSGAPPAHVLTGGSYDVIVP